MCLCVAVQTHASVHACASFPGLYVSVLFLLLQGARAKSLWPQVQTLHNEIAEQRKQIHDLDNMRQEASRWIDQRNGFREAYQMLEAKVEQCHAVSWPTLLIRPHSPPT